MHIKIQGQPPFLSQIFLKGPKISEFTKLNIWMSSLLQSCISHLPYDYLVGVTREIQQELLFKIFKNLKTIWLILKDELKF